MLADRELFGCDGEAEPRRFVAQRGEWRRRDRHRRYRIREDGARRTSHGGRRRAPRAGLRVRRRRRAARAERHRADRGLQIRPGLGDDQRRRQRHVDECRCGAAQREVHHRCVRHRRDRRRDSAWRRCIRSPSTP